MEIWSDSKYTVDQVRRIQRGRPNCEAHGDLWAFIRGRLGLIHDIFHIRSHLEWEQAIELNFTEEQWRGNMEVDKLATKGVLLHVDSEGAFRRIAMRTTLVNTVQRYLVRRAFVMASKPWPKEEGTGPNFEVMARDVHPCRDPLGASAPPQPRVRRATETDRREAKAIMAGSGHVVNEKDDYLFCILCGRAGHKTTCQSAQKKMWAPKCAPLPRFQRWISKGHVPNWMGTHWKCTICDRGGQQLRRASCATAVGHKRPAAIEVVQECKWRKEEIAAVKLQIEAEPSGGTGDLCRGQDVISQYLRIGKGLVDSSHQVAKRKCELRAEEFPVEMADPLASNGDQWRVSRRRLRQKTSPGA